MASLRWPVKVPPTNKCQRVRKLAAKVCPCPRCETLESSASQNVAQKHVNFTQKGTTAPSLLHPVYSRDLPTHHPTNKFTSAFQQIIDSYGIGSYREVNPAPFSIITFPFLFSVMFGDAGHGFLVLLVGLFLVVRERHLVELSRNNEV
ncbi:hypothetical protein LSAT2_019436 [Lamellibrachia satsuma]|nr:hypothetical protein LSAT2_019436 [Lamellibrachia satsuma]